MTMQKDNFPKWDQKANGFYEVWYLKLNLPTGPALWLRFTTLSSKNGLKKVAETWAFFFDPIASGGSKKIAIKNTSTLNAYKVSDDGSIQIEDSVFMADRTSGCVANKTNRIEWDLKFKPNDYTFFHVPKALESLKLTKSVVCKPNVNIHFNGWFSVNGQKYDLSAAPGCQGHIWGKKYADGWAWGHCNDFEGGEDSTIELLSARVKMGGLVRSPQMTAVFFEYKGERFEFNKLSTVLSVKSSYELTKWDFAAENKKIRLVGTLSCDVKDLVGVTYEDTQGAYLFCNNTELASLQLSLYYGGKLETTLKSAKRAAFETVSGQRSPYVEVLV